MYILKQAYKFLPLPWICLTYPEFCAALPPFLQIEPTDHCNLECCLCQRRSIAKQDICLDKNMLSKPLFKKIIDEINPCRVEITGMGEPFINKDITDIILYAKLKGIKVLAFTNATLISDLWAESLVISGIDTLGISIDSAKEETYKKLRGKNMFKRVISGIKSIIKKKKELKSSTPHVTAAFCIQRENFNEIEGFVRLCRLIGADSILFQLPEFTDEERMIGYKRKMEQIDLTEQLKKGEKVSKRLKIRTNIPYILRYLLHRWHHTVYKADHRLKSDEEGVCLLPWIAPYITADGWVKPCCVAGTSTDPSLLMGNIYREPFKKIWNDSIYQSFRRDVKKKGQALPPVCKTCMPRTFRSLIRRL